MCFSPAVSLIVALFEFAVAAIILRRSKILSAFIFLLGFYQFSEFMLCTTQNPWLWAKLGFMAYTLLPAVALHFVAEFTSRKKNYLIHVPAMAAILIAVFKKDFITHAECSRCFVIVRNFFSNPAGHVTFQQALYWFYYFGYIVLCVYLLHLYYKKEANELKKKFALFLMVAVVFSLVPALILFLILPSYRILFPSLYCEFAVLFAVMTLFALRTERKALPIRKL